MTSLWNDLLNSADAVKGRPLISLFEKDKRMERFSRHTLGLMFDFSKTNIDDKTLDLLLELAKSKDVATRRDAMFAGQSINETEGRAVLHTALRNMDPVRTVGGQDISVGLRATYGRMRAFASAVRSSLVHGQGGAITDVVNIGIGGSDLGP